MPNYYTHLHFGTAVLAALPAALAERLAGERQAFELGCLGPDVLFFHHPLLPGRVNREGHSMHRASALPAAERLRRAVEEGLPMARGYAAGFFCHLALDSACHGCVDAMAARGEATHLAIEAELDRALMVEDGFPMVDHRAHMPRVEEAAVWTAAARAYAEASPRQVEAAFRTMERLAALLARTCGRRRGRLLDLAALLVPPARGMRGIALRAEPDPLCAAHGLRLRAIMGEAVAPAAAEITGFFRSVAQNAPLSPWFDRDFKGRVLPPAEGAVMGPVRA